MNIDKFTQKSVEALENSEKLAYEYGNQEVDEEHLLYSLIKLDDSLISSLLEKMGIDMNSFTAAVETALSRKTKVSGDVELRISQSLNKVLLCSADEAKAMGDQYVSVEHIFLTMQKYPNKEVGDIFRRFGIDRDGFLKVLSCGKSKSTET